MASEEYSDNEVSPTALPYSPVTMVSLVSTLFLMAVENIGIDSESDESDMESSIPNLTGMQQNYKHS